MLYPSLFRFYVKVIILPKQNLGMMDDKNGFLLNMNILFLFPVYCCRNSIIDCMH